MSETQSALTQSKTELTPEQIEKLKKEALEAIQMRADVKTVISVFGKVMKTFGLQDIEMTGEGTNIKAVLPVIVKKLSTEMMLGTFDTQALADLQAIMPIIEKYKHLADE